MSLTNRNEQAFSSLSLRDLIEARDLYHFHLMNKANVIGTAIGLYLIRDEEKWPHEGGPHQKLTYARTFGNSHVRAYSWPCILVLVRDWIKEEDFGKPGGPDPWDVVPKRLFLPDGRVVPVCVVCTTPVPQIETRPRAAGGGNTNAGQVTREALRALYEDTNFLRSVAVNGIEHEIAHPSPLNS